MLVGDGNVALGICGKESALKDKYGSRVGSFQMQGYEVEAGFFPAAMPGFEPSGQHRGHVLIEVNAFSCNYRDRALVLRMATMPLPNSYYPIGSELSGVVIDAGSEVEELKVGDRVMIDGYYGYGEQPWGIPTNHSSRRYQVLPSQKLKKVPEGMSDVEAAAFSIGGQTSFSMVRRSGTRLGSRVLVTGGSSNTSLFLISAARIAGGEVCATTTSEEKAPLIRKAGADEVFVLDGSPRGLESCKEIRDYVAEKGGFEVVLDPFADLYLSQVIDLMDQGGSYASCGLERQFPVRGELGNGNEGRCVMSGVAFMGVMTRNIQVIGNCLGSSEDLDRALAAWQAGQFKIAIDSVYEYNLANGGEGSDAVRFLSRSFLEKGRFGKVVQSYS